MPKATHARSTPRAVLRTSSTRNGDDWPEFPEWLLIALTLDKIDAAAYQAAEDRIYALKNAMHERARETSSLGDRHIAMLATIYIWHERGGGDAKPFDMRTTDFNGPNLDALIQALARRASEIIPEVPFKFPTKGA
jgi:hypothetical protein